MTSALRWGGWSAPLHSRFTPGKDPVRIVQEAGWAPGPVWTGAENLAPTGIRSPARPARSESLYRLTLSLNNVWWIYLLRCSSPCNISHLKVNFSFLGPGIFTILFPHILYFCIWHKKIKPVCLWSRFLAMDRTRRNMVRWVMCSKP